MSGFINVFRREYDDAIKEGERAIELNPNGAESHVHFGFILILSDKTELAIKLIKRAFRLNPIPLPHYYIMLAMAYRNCEQYEKAIELSKKSLIEYPDLLSQYLTLAASYSSLNRIDEANKAVDEILRLNPNFSLEYYSAMLPYKNKDTTETFVESLRKAGLPD